MRLRTRVIGAAGIAAVVAAGGSAFTAASSVDQTTVHMGQTAQSVTGVHVNNVVYTYAAATDKTTVISFNTTETLDVNAYTLTVEAENPDASLQTPLANSTNTMTNQGGGCVGTPNANYPALPESWVCTLSSGAVTPSGDPANTLVGLSTVTFTAVQKTT